LDRRLQLVERRVARPQLRLADRALLAVFIRMLPRRARASWPGPAASAAEESAD
jgi:hypothetical protein